MTQWTLSVSLAALAAAGCHPTNEPSNPAGTVTTTAASVTSDNAAAKLGAARCDNEVSCKRIGSGQRFSARSVCEMELGLDARGTLSTDQCLGIDETRLAKCLADIRSANCAEPVTTIDHVLSCQPAALCPSP